MEAGVKVLNPASLLGYVTQIRFESSVLDASDLSFDKHLVVNRREGDADAFTLPHAVPRPVPRALDEGLVS